MSNKISIAIDAMGGDDAPNKTIEGIKFFLEKNIKKNDFVLNIFGKENLIIEKIKKYNIKKTDHLNIINSDYVVSDNETPLSAIKNSKNTSMWNCVNYQALGKADISLSAGNTGVLLVISRMILKMIKEVSKPALAGLWPNQNGMNVVLDLGANIECDEQNLIDYAELGSALYKSIFFDKPKVALLNIGSEEIKGTEILKNASKKLKKLSNEDNFLYTGYIEGNNIMSGKANVIVTDGFTGNVALKTAEGTAKFITSNLKEALTKNFLTKISLIFSYSSLKDFKNNLDPRKYNGAIFLGLNGPVVKSHGGIDSLGFYHSIDLCYKIVKGDLMKQIKNNMSHLNND